MAGTWWAAAVLVVALGAPLAQADYVRTRQGIGYEGKVLGIEAGELVLESAGAKRTIPLGEVARVEVDRYPALGKAEEAYAKGVAGGPEATQAFAEAEKIYEGLLDPRVAEWVRILVQSRLYKLYVVSGRAPKALDAYLEMARSDPALVVGLELPRPHEGDHAANQAMLKKVEAALAEAKDQPYARELERLRVALRILEGKPEEALPLLEPFLASEDAPTRRWAVLKRLDLLLALGRVDEAQEGLKEAEGELGEYPDQVAFYRGRLLYERGVYVDAALEFMKVPILYARKDRGRTAEAIWWAGRAMEAAKLPTEEVVKVYREAAQDYPGTAGSERAKEELARLEAK